MGALHRRQCDFLGNIATTFKQPPYDSTNAGLHLTGGFKNYRLNHQLRKEEPIFWVRKPLAIKTNVVNRALGIRPVSATDAGNCFALKIANTAGFGKFVLDVDMLLLNAQPRSNNWVLDFGVSPDGSSLPTSFTVVSNNFFGTYTNASAFGAYHRTISCGSLLDNQPGPIWIRIWNTASVGGGNRPSVGIDNFSLSFTNIPIVVNPPVITTPPLSQIAYVGDTVTLTVASRGTAPFQYQWYKDNFNTPVGNGTTTLTISPVSTGDAGSYYVVVSNSAGSDTNAVPAVLTVGTRIPIPTTIYSLRTNQDSVNWSPIDTTNLYTVTGVVITRVNMTVSTSASFYIEDTNSLCGIDVFINGDAATRPAFGDIIQVTGPVANFNGVLELGLNSANPTHIVNNLGPSGYSTPAKRFDFSSATNVPLMETNYEGSLVVVSAVTIQNAGVSNFLSGGTLLMTNGSGQTFQLYIDSRLTDIAGQPIPSGLVNITGYISQHQTTAPYTTNYQLVPTYAGDIVAAPATADLSVAMTGPAFVFAGSNLSYTLTVTNAGPAAASSVVVTDSLPTGVTFVSAAGGGANNAGVINWSLGTLAANTTASVSVTVTAPNSGFLTNSASVTSGLPDPDITDNTSEPLVTRVAPLPVAGPIVVSDHTPVISWNAVDGPTYSILWSTNVAGPYSAIATGRTSSPYTDTAHTDLPMGFYQITSP